MREQGQTRLHRPTINHHRCLTIFTIFKTTKGGEKNKSFQGKQELPAAAVIFNYSSVVKDCPLNQNWAPQKPEIIIKDKK
jgi:hypothetical protein